MTTAELLTHSVGTAFKKKKTLCNNLKRTPQIAGNEESADRHKTFFGDTCLVFRHVSQNLGAHLSAS